MNSSVAYFAGIHAGPFARRTGHCGHVEHERRLGLVSGVRVLVEMTLFSRKMVQSKPQEAVRAYALREVNRHYKNN